MHTNNSNPLQYEIDLQLLRQHAHAWAERYPAISRIYFYSGTDDKFPYVLLVEAPSVDEGDRLYPDYMKFQNVWSEHPGSIHFDQVVANEIRSVDQKKDDNFIDKWSILTKKEKSFDAYVLMDSKEELFDKASVDEASLAFDKSTQLEKLERELKWWELEATPYERSADGGRNRIVELRKEIDEIKTYLSNTIGIPLPELLFPQIASPQEPSDESMPESNLGERNDIKNKQPTSGDKKKIEGSDHTGSDPENSFIFQGDFWAVKYNNKQELFRNLERLRYIIYLLEKPNREFYSNGLISLVKGQGVDADTDYGSMKKERLEEERLSLCEFPIEELSDKDKEGLEKQVHKLWDDLYKAKNNNNKTSMKEAEKNWKSLINHFYNLYGIKVKFTSKGPLFMQKSRLTKDAENDRVNVTKNINNAISDIRKNLPQLAEHLERSIRTGSTCRYSPDPSSSIEWHIIWNS